MLRCLFRCCWTDDLKIVTMMMSDEHDSAVAIYNDDDDEGDVKVAAQLLMIMQ